MFVFIVLHFCSRTALVYFYYFRFHKSSVVLPGGREEGRRERSKEARKMLEAKEGWMEEQDEKEGSKERRKTEWMRREEGKKEC